MFLSRLSSRLLADSDWNTLNLTVILSTSSAAIAKFLGKLGNSFFSQKYGIDELDFDQLLNQELVQYIPDEIVDYYLGKIN